MPIASMTGFARADGDHAGRRFVWEVKSVNARGLEARVRLPSGFERLEAPAKKALSKIISRGSVFVSLNVLASESQSSFRLNESAMKDVISWVRKVESEIECTPPSAVGILGLRGVIESKDSVVDEDEASAFDSALLAAFESAAKALAANRQTEGKHLAKMLGDQLTEIERLSNLARENESTSLNFIRAQIQEQLAELLDNNQLSEDRLTQEASLLAIKADIREEIDRLDAHIAAARDLLKGGGAVGRRLDFLTQELNREANTLSSKSNGMALKRIGLDLKTVVDQMREQVQNVE